MPVIGNIIFVKGTSGGEDCVEARPPSQRITKPAAPDQKIRLRNNARMGTLNFQVTNSTQGGYFDPPAPNLLSLA